MKQKKLVLLASIMLVIIALVVGGWIATNRQKDAAKTGNNVEQQNSDRTEEEPTVGKQICPDAWYDNQMPGPAEDAGRPSQYFIVNGQRAELNELDVEWVKANCSVNEPRVVQ